MHLSIIQNNQSQILSIRFLSIAIFLQVAKIAAQVGLYSDFHKLAFITTAGSGNFVFSDSLDPKLQFYAKKLFPPLTES